MCRGAYVLMFEEAGEGHPGVFCHLSPSYSLEMGLVVKLELVIRQAAIKPQHRPVFTPIPHCCHS